MSSDTVPQSSFARTLALALACNLVAYHAGGWTLGPAGRRVWVELGAVAWLFAETAFALIRDYHLYKDAEAGERGQYLSGRFAPPQLALKGGWGALLVAFLFVLISAQGMAERGYVLPGFALVSCGAGYVAARYQGKMFLPVLSAGVSTWFAFGTALYVAAPEAPPGFVALGATGTLFIILTWAKARERN